MNSTLPSTPEPAPRGRSTSWKVVAVVAAIIGGLALVAATVVAAIAIAAAFTSQGREPAGDTQQTVLVDGVTELSVDIAAGDFRLVFADTDEARLDIPESSRQEWRMERRGSELVVDAGSQWFGSGFCLFGCNSGPDQVVLTLPLSLDGTLDADLSLQAGSLHADGAFLDLDLDVAAGSAAATGSARSLSVNVSAGQADLRFTGVREAEYEVSAGKITAELSGAAPRDIEIEVAAGSLDLTLVDVPYAVTSNVGAGQLDNGLQTGPGSAHVIDVRVEAGKVTLRPGEQ